MRKAIKIVLAVFLAICLALGWLIYANWNSIEAFIHSINTTNEDTIKELEQNKQELEDFLAGEESITVRDLTEEEAKALNEGSLSEEELIGILTGNTPEETPKPTKEPAKEPAKEPVSPQKPTSTQTPTSEEIISQLIAKLYVQKSQYLNKLDEIEESVRNDYIANENNWDTLQAAKQDYLKKYLPVVASWEKTCDDVVFGILDEIRAELKKQGKDDTIVDTMKSSYREEKKLKKTYFINRYMD